VQVRLLGPVDVLVAGNARPVAGIRRKAVLAVLALAAGEIVSADRLIDIVWGGKALRSPANALQSNISYLRSVLGTGTAIVARPPGYLLDAPTDLQAAESLVEKGRQTADQAEAASCFRAALALWRGKPLADVAGIEWLDAQTGRLDELRMRAVHGLVEARLDLGEHAQVVSELERLSAEYPFDEQVHGHLMLALYRSGRQADALAAYHRLRQALGDELGIDPGPALRDLEAAILRQDPSLEPAPRTVTVVAPAPPVPRELPVDVYAFSGREPELAELDRILGTDPPIAVISGTGGVGKTGLAVHWAHREAERFPDGHLYLDLRGYHSDEPLTADQALASLLGSLGASDIPAELGARSARYRSLLAGRRMLLLLDNALNADQVRPLLPGTPACKTVVTSRDDLAGLVARDGARRLNLDPLAEAEAHDLLGTLIGARAAAEPVAAAALVGHCAGLPLMLRVAAELVASRRGVALRDLVAELATERQRLDLGSDGSTALRAVFSWSERHLPPEAIRFFRLLGVHPGRDLDSAAAAALTGIQPDSARQLAERLGRAHLIERSGADRWTMHDLLRAYARDRAVEHIPEPDRVAALTRLYDWYLTRAATAVEELLPYRAGTSGAAKEWLDAERLNLVAAASTTNEALSGPALAIARTVARYLDIGYHNAEAFAIYRRAMDTAEGSGDQADLALATYELGRVHSRAGRLTEAIDHYERALDLFRQLGDVLGQARTYQAMGNSERNLARHDAALAHYRKARVLFRKLGHGSGEAGTTAGIGRVRWVLGHRRDAMRDFSESAARYAELGDFMGQGRVLNDLGNLNEQQGRLTEAYEYHEHARRILHEVGDRAGEACSLIDIGRLRSKQDRHTEAFELYERALATFREIGDPIGEVETLIEIGDAYQRQDRWAEALEEHRQAHILASQVGDPMLAANALNGQGRSLCALGRPAEGLALHTAARTHAVNIGDRYRHAQALDGMARACAIVGRHQDARRYWTEALDIYAALGLPEAEEVRSQLSA
jgi:DNA-binding SARP family transcriptional activator/Tfp pilus assembly protein PilF